jgi:hypothetical protein
VKGGGIAVPKIDLRSLLPSRSIFIMTWCRRRFHLYPIKGAAQMGFKIDDDLFRHHPPHFRIVETSSSKLPIPRRFKQVYVLTKGQSCRYRLAAPVESGYYARPWAMPEDNLELALHMGGRERPPRPSDSLMGAERKGSIKLGPVWSYPLKGAKK